MAGLGIEFLSVFGLPPVEFVHLAADLGCQHISTGLTAAPYDPPFHPPFSLRDDAELRRAMVAAMAERGVSVSLGEGMAVRPGRDVSDLAPDLAVMAELGVTRVNTLSMDPDLNRAVDQFGLLVDLAAAAGMATTVEVSPSFIPGSLPDALELIAAVGPGDLRLLVDTMHIVRTGGTAADLAAVPAETIGYVQLCDAPLASSETIPYGEEAMFRRQAPGDGELPLLDLLLALPDDVVISLEVPNQAHAGDIDDLTRWLTRCVEGARDLIAQRDAQRSGTG